MSHEIERARELIGLRRPKEAAAAALRHLAIELTRAAKLRLAVLLATAIVLALVVIVTR